MNNTEEKIKAKEIFENLWRNIDEPYSQFSPIVKKITKKVFWAYIFVLVLAFAMIVFGFIGFSLEILALQIILYIGCFIVVAWIIRLSIPFRLTKFGEKTRTFIK